MNGNTGNKEINIIEASPQDAGQLLEYTKIVGSESHNLSYGAEGIGLSIEQEQNYVTHMHEDPKSVFYCAWIGEEIAGVATLSPFARHKSHRAELGISVQKKYWHQGVGTALMEKLIQYARTAGLEQIQLNVISDNARAIALYTRFGFKKIATFPDYAKTNGKYLDANLMLLDLRG